MDRELYNLVRTKVALAKRVGFLERELADARGSLERVKGEVEARRSILEEEDRKRAMVDGRFRKVKRTKGGGKKEGKVQKAKEMLAGMSAEEIEKLMEIIKGLEG